MTVVERTSSHPLYQARLLQEEYARWGLCFRTSQAMLMRGIRELDLADYVMIPSDFVRASFVGEGFPEERLLQVPFGVDVHRFRPVSGRSNHPFRVLFVGQVGIRKGVPHLLEAWHHLGWYDAELWLVGQVEVAFRPLMRRWERLAKVRLIGYALDPVALYQQADIFVFPSVEEGSALVTYEALACGLPVVTTPNAGSVVRDGVEGFIVPIRDVATLAGRMEQLRANEHLRREMGKAARARAEEFTWEEYGNRMATICKEKVKCRMS